MVFPPPFPKCSTSQEKNLSPRLVKLRFDFFEAKRRDLHLNFENKELDVEGWRWVFNGFLMGV
jgi:hypothetical protein